MSKEDLLGQLLHTWRIHNAINLDLIRRIPAKGFAAVPPASKGRTVADQLAHMNNVRLGWLRFNGVKLGKSLQRFRSSKRAAAPSPQKLLQGFRASGPAVEDFLRARLATGGKVKMFKGNPVRWLGYLISHESHHRGQIALALKQNGMRLPEAAAMGTLWRTWVWGKVK